VRERERERERESVSHRVDGWFDGWMDGSSAVSVTLGLLMIGDDDGNDISCM